MRMVTIFSGPSQEDSQEVESRVLLRLQGMSRTDGPGGWAGGGGGGASLWSMDQGQEPQRGGRACADQLSR
jgi:hypothetical protein